MSAQVPMQHTGSCNVTVNSAAQRDDLLLGAHILHALSPWGFLSLLIQQALLACLTELG